MRMTVEDAKRPLVFEITEQDVKDAKRYDKSHCVIACAVRAVPGIQGIFVGTSIVRVKSSFGIRRYMTPLNLKRALAEFDDSGNWALPAGVYALKPPVKCLTKEVLTKKRNAAGQPLNPRTGKPYKKTGKRRLRAVNPRVLEFAKIKKAEKATKKALRMAKQTTKRRGASATL
jgi:hypothetical protein